MIRIAVSLAGLIVIIRAALVVAHMGADSYGTRLRWWLFAGGYALLGAMTASAVIDALAGNGTLTQLGFVTASALLILGERRQHRRSCNAAYCPKAARRRLEKGAP